MLKVHQSKAILVLLTERWISCYLLYDRYHRISSELDWLYYSSCYFKFTSNRLCERFDYKRRCDGFDFLSEERLFFNFPCWWEKAWQVAIRLVLYTTVIITITWLPVFFFFILVMSIENNLNNYHHACYKGDDMKIIYSSELESNPKRIAFTFERCVTVARRPLNIF